MLNITLISTVS